MPHGVEHDRQNAPSLAAVRRARSAQDAAADALRATLDSRQQDLLDALLSAVHEHDWLAQQHLVAQLAALVAGLGPTFVESAATVDDGPELFGRRSA